MRSPNKEFSEFSVGPTRLRVISDCSADIATIVEAEKRVIHSFVDHGLWRQDAVTLFILENLAPLVGQLQQLHDLNDQEAARLPQHPMVNLYDLRNPLECFVFVNFQVMCAEGYWGDAVAAEGLLAHEHAHPLGECAATTAARSLRVAVDAPALVVPLLAQLGETLSVGAVSELMSNDICIGHGFDAALAHVDRMVIKRAVGNLSQRPELQRRLTAAGSLDVSRDRLLLLLADAQGTLPFALELAPFFRAGRAAMAMEIVDILRQDLLPRLEPEIQEMFFALHDLFLRPRPEWDATWLRPWCDEVLAMLSASFSKCGPHVGLRLSDGDPSVHSMRPS